MAQVSDTRVYLLTPKLVGEVIAALVKNEVEFTAEEEGEYTDRTGTGRVVVTITGY
jgi:hypothetical protein